MDECFFCGISDEKKRLFHAIHQEEGIISVCEQCSIDEHLPLLKKPTTFQLKESERRYGIYDRLSKAAGIDPEQHRKRHEVEKKEFEEKLKKQELAKEEIGLKDIIERNLKMKSQNRSNPRLGMIDNFNWIIMRARRKRKITLSQLAEEIKESEVALKMAEQGILPEDDFRLVNKLENFLGIRIRDDKKVKISVDEKKLPARIVNFKPEAIKDLTIADLKEMKKQREQALIEEEENNVEVKFTATPAATPEKESDLEEEENE